MDESGQHLRGDKRSTENISSLQAPLGERNKSFFPTN